MKTIILLIAVTFGSGIEADFIPIQPFAVIEDCLKFVDAIQNSPLAPDGILICFQGTALEGTP